MQRSQDIQQLLMNALQEDIGRGDLTSASIIPESATGEFAFRAREQLVLCGVGLVGMMAAMGDDRLGYTPHFTDGGIMQGGEVIATVSGSVRSILMLERVALNLLQHLSGIATETYQYVRAIEGTSARIVDTRKTLPGLRDLQKYAVRCGGGFNHRLGLDDGVLIKDNHISAVKDIATAVAAARANTPLLTKIEVECDTLEQVRAAIAAEADIIMLDNMPLDTLQQAVTLCHSANIRTEASGNVTLQTVRDIAQTGVDYISVGRLTHSVRAVDIGLDAV